MARVNALLQEVLAEEIERLSDVDDRLSMATVTGVECAPDLKSAVVYLSSLDAAGAAAFEEHRRELQSSIAHEVRMRRVPQLSFLADPAVAAGSAIEEALRRVRRHNEQR